MNLGKQIRLNRLFSHSSGRLVSVAVDHFMSYGFDTLPPGLRQIERTMALVAAGKPDSMTMQKGIAAACWPKYAGKFSLVVQSSIVRQDDTVAEQLAGPEDAIRLGADAVAVVAFLGGPNEGKRLKVVADCVKQAERFEIPVILHVYPRRFGKKGFTMSFEPEDIAFGVRCGLECGVDVIKTPYSGDVKSYAQIVSECPRPIVASGGPQLKSHRAALQMLADVCKAGGRGGVVGRNVWGFAPNQITSMVRAMRLVIHDNKTPADALRETSIQ